MATVSEVTAQAASSLVHIDALLDQGPGWNWVAPARTTLFYTFALNDGNASDIGASIAAAPSAFNAAQQAAAVQVLGQLAQITGITFVATADGAAADLHFGAVDILGASTSGFCSARWSYSSSGGNIVSYSADAYIYLDNANFAAMNNAPTAGNAGYEVLLHELGHAMGLKHPFEGGVRLSAGNDNTQNTLMSYTQVGGPHSSYSPYDVAALRFLYGGDGLGGALGQATSGNYLTGTSSAETLNGGNGNDVLEGGSGNDTLTGGGGNDTAVYSAARALFTVTATASGYTVSGPDGTDTLTSIESLRFADQTLALGGGGGNSAPTGGLTVQGIVQQGSVLTLASTVADGDGLGAFSYRWQSSPDGNTWTDIAGANAATFSPGESHVSLRLRAVASYTDGAGHAEAVNSTATAAVANLNDAPTGAITLTGTPKQDQPMTLTQNLADADGLGPLALRWQQSGDGTTWIDIAGTAGRTTFTPAQAQVGQLLRVLATYTDGHGTAESVASAATAAVRPGNQAPGGSLVVGGTAQQGSVLTVTSTLTDADGMGALTLQWQLSTGGTNWSDISGAQGGSLTLTEAQVGRLLRVVASYTDGQGTAETVTSSATAAVANVNDAPSGGIRLVGTPRQGSTLSISSTLADADGLGTLAWRWQSSSDGLAWTDIAGAAASQFAPGQAQVGLQLRALGAYIDGHGTTESAATAASAAVQNTNDAPTGSVRLSGTARQGQVLTATQTLADLDGLGPISFRWESSRDNTVWTAVGDANTATLDLTQSLVGQRIRAVASYADGGGTTESVPSAGTVAVINVNDAPSGLVLLPSTARLGQALAPNVSLADADGLGTLRYEWQQSPTGATWQVINGATGSSFTPAAAQVGQFLRVVVRYTDAGGAAESMASTAASVVRVTTGTAGADVLMGGAGADELKGLAGNDRLTGDGSDDLLQGGDDLDVAVMSGPRSGYDVLRSGSSSWTVRALSGSDGTDTLELVERVAFADGSLALDLNGNAGVVARDLGAVFGRTSVQNAVYAGIGLGLLDGGMSPEDLMQLALDTRLGSGFTPTELVQLLYDNLTGAAPSSADLALYVGALEAGQYSAASLAMAAAALDLNAQNIDLVGLTAHGLAYTPAG